MPRVLESDEDYQRFEKTVDSILERLKGTKPRVVVNKKVCQSGGVSIHAYSREKTLLERWVSPVYKGTDNVNRSIEVFRRRYGIGMPKQDTDSIAKEMGFRRILGDALYYSGKSAVEHRTNFISEVLKQQYKRQIWYGTLG